MVSLETWHVTNKDSLAGGENREERVGELRNMARHKRGLTPWRGGRERSRLVSLETWHVTNDLKRGLTNWRGRGRSGLVSSETWHVTNEDSQTGGEKREEQVGELGTS